MSIEEPDPIKSVEAVSDGMILLHVSDSNRRAPGRGHVPFPRLLGEVRRLGYRGPWIVECTPPEVDPFAVNPKNFDRTLEEVANSISYLRDLKEEAPDRFANDCITSSRGYNGDHDQRMLF